MTDPSAKPPNSSGAFMGFDCADYPGDNKMQVWAAQSPYHFAGYYLQAPCHKSFIPWQGQRAALVGMGWNLVVIYLGQQPAGASPCKQNVLTGAQGLADANDAAGKTAADGFPPGTYIYLDIEGSGPVSTELKEYTGAWVSQLLTTGFVPGIYCHRRIAVGVQAAVLAAYPQGNNAPPPRFWVAGDDRIPKFNVQTSKPADSGVAFANGWQSLPGNRSWGGATLSVDENVFDRPDPSGA